MRTKHAIIIVILLEVAVAGLGIFNYGFTIDGLQAVTRFSGRLSLILFTTIFLLYPGKRLTSMLSEKFFLAFAIAHGIHLMELLSFVYLSGTHLALFRLAGGGLAYAFIFVMPWIHHRHHTGHIAEKRHALFTNVYLFYVWFIFLMTYLTRILGKVPNAGGTPFEHRSWFLWVLIILAARILMMMIPKRTS
jgi:hypothetical protein